MRRLSPPTLRGCFLDNGLLHRVHLQCSQAVLFGGIIAFLCLVINVDIGIDTFFDNRFFPFFPLFVTILFIKHILGVELLSRLL
ncbi:hypothetical protein D3C72_1987900 [compost metagenome]